ncbi:MAG: ComEC/Rec2 family competence protein, partial [Chlamydiia bacterium]|nr:ComEC/Rec2 family competence protein [Chlamydiia bacterium]
QWKEGVKRWIESHYSHPSSGMFLSGLATGQFDDPWMREQFARFGLQHILAISGFHFAVIALFLNFILRLLFRQKIAIILLIAILGLYCIFLGPQPSILRAWLMCSIPLVGMLIQKQSSALNTLGIALLFLLTFDPYMIQELGFQLSFGTTAAILLFFQPMRSAMFSLLGGRKMGEVMEMTMTQQHGYLILGFIRESLALALAVNVFALPLTLFYFQQFPWMSLLYNVFFPLLTSISMCLLLTGSMMSFIPPLSKGIHFVNDHLTYFLLQLTYQIPHEVDLYLKLETFPSSLLVLSLTLTSVWGIYRKSRAKEMNGFEAIAMI